MKQDPAVRRALFFVFGVVIQGVTGIGYGTTTGESMAHELVPLMLFTNA